MIKMKLGEVVVADRALRELDEQDLPYALAKAIDNILRKVEGDVAFFNKNLQALFEEFGEEREARPEEKHLGERVRAVKPVNAEEFQQRLTELEGLPIDLGVEPLDLAPYADRLTIKRRQMEKIRPLVK